MTGTADHAALMDRTYRHQRRIYDATRRYFLLGRDHLLVGLAPPRGGRVLEVGCGTGRNLAWLARRHPDCALFGLDISGQMLMTARARLGKRARLARADACDADMAALFGGGFDRVVLSYSLSMIPDWERALCNAVAQLRPGGSVHVVDFGDQAGLPGAFRNVLLAWLARFHVAPRTDLPARMRTLASEHGLALRVTPLFRGYACHGVLTRPAGGEGAP